MYVGMPVQFVTSNGCQAAQVIGVFEGPGAVVALVAFDPAICAWIIHERVRKADGGDAPYWRQPEY